MMSILFEEMTIQNMVLPNRFVRSATYDGCAERPGRVSERQIKLFEDLAQGGAGLIISGIAHVHPSGQISVFQNSIADDDDIAGLKRLTSAVHDRGAKIAVQLFHAGRERAKVFKGRGKEALAPSFIPNDPYFNEPYRPMEEDHIWEMIRSFGDAAKRAGEAGFDAVQVHGAHAYLLSQFLSPFTNRREDDWGGSLENRLRFHREIFRDIRAKVGRDFPVLIKIGVEDGFPQGLGFDEGKIAAELLAEWGYDALEISSGLRGQGYNSTEFRTGISRPDREAYFRHWCQELKPLVKAPVMMVGGLRSFEIMEEVIRRGEADFVSLCRPLIREPGLINEWKGGNHRKSTCLSCNKCYETILKGEPLHCARQKDQGN
ncbi:MAG: NADH:flavin oxidoreductase [Deltaproteobacteria bacterium]|nr:NADH:flavin oxidoreductase [Deltaproteobacteria bacterium]